MCFNEEASVAIYVLGCLGALYAWKSHSKLSSFSIAAVSQIQLLEYLMWSDQSCGATNEWASYAVIWVLYLHVVGLPVVAWLVQVKTRAIRRYIIPIGIAIVWTVGAGFLTSDCSDQPELCSTKGDGDRLQWAPMTVVYDKSHSALLWTMMVSYFGIWLYVYLVLYADVTFSTPPILTFTVLALGIGLSVYWGGDNWFDIFGSLWCTFGALAGIINVTWYARKTPRYLLISYKDDHRSLVTFYTLLHIASGYGIGAAAHALDMGVQFAAFTAMAAILGWEVLEYWAAPVLGYWTVMNTGNTAMDIATGLWPFMVAAGWAWPSTWTFLLIVPGAVVGHAVRCTPYETPTLTAYVGCDQPCLVHMYGARKWVYNNTIFKGVKNINAATFPLDPYMTPSSAHRVLAAGCLLAVLLAVGAPEQAVACLASFAFGYALGIPTIAHPQVYDNWYRAMKCDKALKGCDGSNCTRHGCGPGCCGCDSDCLCKKTRATKEDTRLLF